MRCVFFFFKQKTAYEIYQCDWSSDVCSSDLGMQFWQGPTNIWAAVYPPEDTVLYEYPKGSIKNTIFNENIWVGGMDENGQFRLAAERYCGIGKDFWEGPLSISGSEVSIDTSTVMKWHRVWKLNVDQIIYHKNHWKDSGYQPIEAIATWPAHGDPKLNQADYLADRKSVV